MKKGFALPLVLFAVFVLVMVVGVVYYASRLNSEAADAKRSLEQVKGEKNQLEKDLIYYKNTDLGKEVELLNLKLQNSQEKLAGAQRQLEKTAEIPKITNIISMMMATFAKQPPDCYSQADKSKIEQGLSAIGDARWVELWGQFINNTSSANCGSGPESLYRAVDHGLGKISNITGK